MEKTNEERKYCVYMHRFENKKVYIGQTSLKPEKRWGKNGAGYLLKDKTGKYHQPLMARAIEKYGWDTVEHIILFDNLSLNEANRIEQICIVLFRSNDKQYGYNIENGGNTSGKTSDETRKKLSKALRGRTSPNKGKSMSEEQKEKISKAKIGKSNGPMSEETKRKISEATKGKIMSEDAKKKISNARKECWKDEKYRQNQIEKHKWQTGENHPFYGKHHTDEAKEKLRQARTKAHVWCVELNELFNSAEDVKRKLGIDASDVRKVCNGLKQSAGKHPITGEKLHWRFVDKEVVNNESIVV